MKYLNDTILCLEGSEFVKTDKNPDGLVAKSTYLSLKHRGNIVTYGRGGNGSQVLIEYESLPQMYKSLVISKYGDPYEYISKEPLRQLIKPDVKAIQFFTDYLKPDGFPLKKERQIQYSNNAAILNALSELLSDKKRIKKDFKITMDSFWKKAGEIVKEVSKQFPNSLPTSDRRLKDWYKEYKANGYASLISGKVGNDNRRKVDDELERLLLSIYSSGKPYAKEVAETFERFMVGELELSDEDGVLFEREQFFKNGEPIAISDTTVWSYINNPGNRITVDKLRTGKKEFNDTHRPHHHRHSPVWSFSKTTMDDLEIPFKLPNGERVKSYQIADVTSGCIVGKAFGTDKNRGLFLDAVVDMFRLIVHKGWGVPAEIEVEHHIANTFTDDLLKAGNVFTNVRFCAPANPQEKRAEHIFRWKKYGLQKKREGFQGRWYGRQEATRPNEDKSNKRIPLDDIIANEEADIKTWNHSLHPNQQAYPGMTRWQVLCEMQNPQLVTPNLGLLSRYIGVKTSTSINRSQYVQVKYAKYSIPSVSVLNKLQANNYDVDAYYIPDVDGLIREVHLYQNDQYICTCQKLSTYNESAAEQTDSDITIRTAQKEYVKAFDTAVKEKASRLAKVKIHDASVNYNDVEADPLPPVSEATPMNDDNGFDDNDDIDYWSQKALEDV